MKSGFVFLSYIGTLGVGIAAGVLGARSYFKKRESERADAEIESMKRAMRKIEERKENEPAKEDVVATSHILKGTTAAHLYREYSTFSPAVTEDHPREEDAIKPYFIDIDDFDTPTLGYAKKELQYYMDDGTLVDEGENTDDEGAIISIVDTVGVTNLESFENSLESCCYIRNEQLKEDYEISKVFGSYGMLLGED